MESESPPRRARGHERRASAPRFGAWTWLGCALAVAVGSGLRLHNLGGQVLGGDELHAVRAALRDGLGRILTTFQLADNSIPLTALYRLALELGLPLSDATLRIPVLAAGVALLALAPPLLARRLGPAASLLFAWLLAISPLLVLYSRIVRPYMPATLLAIGAIVAFDRWLVARRPADGAAYAGLAAGAVWLHLLAAPCVLAPLAFAGGLRALGRERAPGAAALAALAGGLAVAIGVLLLPALPSLLESVAARRQGSSLGSSSLLDVLRLAAGTAHAPLALLLLAAAARGLALLRHSEPRWAAYSAWIVAVQLAAIALAAPYQSHRPIVFQRYALFVLPLGLAWAAVGLAAPWRTGTGPRARALQLGAVALLVAVLFGTGPLLRPAFRRGSFAHHNDFVGFHRAAGRMPDSEVPRFYRELAASDESGVLLEYPWVTWWDLARSLPAYQALHGRPVRVAPRSGDLADPRLRLRGLVAPDPAAFLASDARWLIVHLDVGAEEERVRGEAALVDEADSVTYRARFWPPLRAAGQALAAHLATRWGAPDYADARIQAWDLARVRRRAGAQSGLP